MTQDGSRHALDEVFDRRLEHRSGPLLTLSGVNVSFAGIHALSGVDLEVRQHDVLAIIGPNGAGKSTLLNAICGIVDVRGQITFNGRQLAGRRPAEIAAAGLGRSFQDPPLIEHYTVLENVVCGAHLRLGYRMFDQVLRRRKVSASERMMEQKAMALLDFVGLAGRAGVRVGELAYGARKRVDIARAMVSGPRLLLLDEPSSGLDGQERDALTSILLLLREQERVGILVVEHHMDLVRATASRVVALQAGSVLMAGDPDEVLSSEVFRSAVVGGAEHEAADAEPVDDLGVSRG